jgi:hypothetical protein
MIELTPEDIKEFRALFKRDTGREISEVDARAYALSIIQLVALVRKREPDSGSLPPP